MPDLQLLQPWLVECHLCTRKLLVFTKAGVAPAEPPRGWFEAVGDWVCDRHHYDENGWEPSDADYPAVIEVPE